MYYGKMTKELEELYNEYYEIFKIFPSDHEEVDYGDETKEDYYEYVNDIKRAIKKKKTLPKLLGLYDYYRDYFFDDDTNF